MKFINPTGPGKKTYRILRGGAQSIYADYLVGFGRIRGCLGYGAEDCGFRIVCNGSRK